LTDSDECILFYYTCDRAGFCGCYKRLLPS